MPKQIVNISDTIKQFQEKFNTLSTDLGWKGQLTTTEDSDVVGALNEVDYRLDSINSNQINSPHLFIRDSSETSNIIKGGLKVHGQIYGRQAVDLDATLNVEGDVTLNSNITLGNAASDNVVFNADVNSNIIPNTDDTYDLGSSGKEWKDLYLDGTGYIDTLAVHNNADIDGTLNVDGATTLNGHVDLGNATSDNISVVGRVDTNIVPDVNGTYDLGSSTLEWNNLYLDGTAHVDTLDVDANAGIIGTLNVGDSAQFQDNVSVAQNLHVTGNTTMGGTLVVDGEVTFKAGANSNINLGDGDGDNVVFNAEVNSSIIPNTDNTYSLGSATKEWKDLFIDGTAHIDTLDVDINATVAGTLGVTGATTLNGHVDLGNATGDNISIVGRVDTNIVPDVDNSYDLGSSTLEWRNLYLDGTAHVDTLDVDANAGIIGTLNVTGATSLASTLGVTGATSLASTLGVTGATTLSSTLGVTGATTLNGHVDLGNAASDNISVVGRVDTNIVPDSDNKYDLGSSSLEWKDLYLDGTAHVDTLDVDVNATVAGTLGVTGATTLSDTLGVTNATTLSSTLGVTGATTLSSTLGVTGATTLSSTLGVAGIATLSSDSQFPLNITGTHNQKIKLSGSASPMIEFHEGTDDRMTFGYSSLDFGQWKVWDDDSDVTAISTLRLRSDGTLKISGNNGINEHRIFAEDYHPNADTWTTARSHTVTLTGKVTGTTSQSVDGSGAKTWSIATSVVDASTTNKGIAKYNTNDFTVSSGDVSIKTSGVSNTQIANSYWTVADSAGTTHQVDLGGTLTIHAGEGIDTVVSDTNSTVTVKGEDASTTNKGVAKFNASDFSTSSGNVSIKTSGVSNTQIANSFINIAADAGTTDQLNLGETFTIAAGEGINTTVSNNKVTVEGENASTTNKGVAKFNASDFTVSSGDVSIKSSGVSNTQIANSYWTVADSAGDTYQIDLGDTLNLVGAYRKISVLKGVDDTITFNLDSDVWVDNDLKVGNDATVAGNLLVTGDFVVSGATRTVSHVLKMGEGVSDSSAPSLDGIISFDRGNVDSAQLKWNETHDWWEAGTTNDMAHLVREGDSASLSKLSLTGPLKMSDSASLSKLSLTGPLKMSDSASIGKLTTADLIVGGNLTVSGTTTTVNTETINLADNIILLNSNATGTPSENSGIEVERGSSTNVDLRFKESSDRWEFTNDGSTHYNIPVPSEYTSYSHPTHPGDDFSVDTGALTGATVVSDIDINVTTDTLGHVTDANGVVQTRDLTPGDIGALPTSGGTMTGDISFEDEHAIVYRSNQTGTPGTQTTNIITVERGTAANAYISWVDGATDYWNIGSGTGINHKLHLGTIGGTALAFDHSSTKSQITSGGVDLEIAATGSGNKVKIEDDTDINGDVLISGDLTVSGTTTTVNTETINLADNIILLNSNATGTPSENSGIEVERGSSTNVDLRFNESNDRWQFTNDGSTHYNIPVPSEYTSYTHPTHPGDDFSVDTGALTGATVVSDIDINVTTDTLGHVTDANGTVSTRTITAANVGALPITGGELTGDLGIGEDEDNFYTKLVVGDLAGADEGIQIASSTTGKGSLLFADGGGYVGGGSIPNFTQYRGWLRYDHNTDKMDIATAGGPRLTIDSSGNTTITGIMTANGTSSSSAPKYTFNGDNNTGLGYIGSDAVGLIAGGSRKFYVSGTTAYFQNLSGGVDISGDLTVSGTVDGRDVSVDGAKLDTIDTNANYYIHPTHPGDDIDIDTTPLTGATVISDLDFNVTTDTLGHVTDANGIVSTRTLTLADLGYTGVTGADNYGGWDLWVEGTDRGVISSSENVKFVGGTNVSLSYSTTGDNTITINSTSGGATELDDLSDAQTGTGTNCMGIGNGAQDSITSGNASIAIGAYAQANQTNVGTANNTLGYLSMANATGNYNNAFGYFAMKGTTTGNSNSAFGHSALSGSGAKTGNSAFGSNALIDVTTGEYNIGIGYEAGDDITTGSNNTIIGRLAGSTSLSSTVLIGAGDTERLKINSTGLYVNGSATPLTNYSLPLATDYTRGGIELFSDTDQTVAANSVTTTAGRTYGIQLNSNDQAVVNVPWTNTGATDIDGLSDARSFSSLSSYGLGADALNASMTGGSNTAVGGSTLTAITSGYNNTAVGVSALRLNTTGTDSTGLGQQALYDQTTGHGNTAVGKESLSGVTTGQNNIGIGKKSGEYITTGSNNTVLGDLNGTSTMSSTVLLGAGSTERLKIDSTGLYVNGSTTALAGGASDIDGLSDGYYDGESIGLGSGALASDNGNDNYNVAVGKSAATATTSGYRNCAVGWWSLKSNISGNSNVAIGAAALKSNTYGHKNIAIGGQALFYNTTGSENTAIGYDAAKATTTAEDNTAVGHGALTHITTGVRNIAIGHSAGAGLTTGHENVIIGKLAAPTASMSFTVLVGCGTTERLKIDSTGLYVNGSTTALAGGATELDDLSDALTTNSGKTIALGSGAGASASASGGSLIAIGKDAGSSYVGSGTNANIAIGYEALKNATSSANVAIGHQSLANLTGLANANTAIGHHSGNLMSSSEGMTILGAYAGRAVTTGDDSTLIGRSAGKGLTTGSKNTFVGKDCGENVTTGSNNTIIGQLVGSTTLADTVLIGAGTTERLKVDSTGLYVNGSSTALAGGASDINGLSDGYYSTNFSLGLGDGALYSHTSGGYNTAVGYRALYSNTTGGDNVAVGQSALKYATTAYSNTSVGNNSSNRITTGGSNTVVGDAALYNTTTGSKNSAYGTRTLFSNTTGSYNSAYGYESLRYNTTGHSNAASGYHALRLNTTGTLNVGIGHGAGDAITTGSNNTVIGDLAGTSAMASTVLLGAGSTERLKIDSTGLYVNGSSTALVGGASDIDGLSDGYYDGGSVGLGSGALANDDGTNNANVAVGVTALNNATTAQNNAAVGYQALYQTTTGESNSAVGAQALLSNTTGGYGSALGWYSLKNNTTGFENTSVGQQSLRLNTTGSWNTSVGANNNRSNITGNYNASLGYKALYYNTDSQNSAFGTYASRNNSTGTNNTTLGYNAGEAITTGGSNTVLGSLSGTSTMASTVLIGAGTTERLKIDSTGLYVNGSATALGGGASPLVKTANYTASSGDIVVAGAGSITITLPSSPSVGDSVIIKDGTGTVSTTSFTVNGGGANIASSATALTFNLDWNEIRMVYINTTIGWSV